MMWILWMGITLMTIVAIGFVLYPLLLRRTANSITSNQYTLELLSEKLQQLQLDYQSGVINKAVYQQAQIDINKAVIDDVDGTQTITVRNAPIGVILLLAGFMIVAAALGYWYWGNSSALAQYLFLQRNDVKSMLANPDVPAITRRLVQHLQSHPNSAQGWYLLAKLYLGMNNNEQAIVAFEQAYKLNPTHLETQLYYAQALFLKGQQRLTPQARDLLLSVLAANPSVPLALNLLAIDAYQHHAYQQAIYYWEKLLPLYSPLSDEGKALLKAIASAQKALVGK